MLPRFKSAVTWLTLVTHLLVTFVVAPWHHFTEHQVSATANAQSCAVTRPASGCRCHRHIGRSSAIADIAAPEAIATGEPQSPSSPAEPEHDDCSVCQTLAQQFVTSGEESAALRVELVYAVPLLLAQRPKLGMLFDPISRGPPSV